jgi:hypothetical protein
MWPTVVASPWRRSGKLKEVPEDEGGLDAYIDWDPREDEDVY